MRRSVWLFLSVFSMSMAAAGDPSDSEGPPKSASALRLALHYEFLGDQLPRIEDLSGNEHHGLLDSGEIVYGRRKNAVKLEGKGRVVVRGVPDSLNPASRSLTVGAFCQPAALDGVLVAMGDKVNGFSLYVKDGVPHFAVRAQGELFAVAAREPIALGQWIHLAGAIDAKGELWLITNGWPGASAAGRLIPAKPAESLCVGADPGSPVGEYPAPSPWQGLVQDVRLYWGFMNRNDYREEWGEWADLPGCGCKR